MSFKRIKNVQLLETYKQIYGDLMVPPKFIAPPKSGTPWPVTGQPDFNLGQYVSHIRQQRKKNIDYYDPSDVNFLIDLGFVWKVSDHKSKIVLDAAETYYKLHGNLNSMKHRFEVPRNDAQWPAETWGLKLQSILQNVKHVHIHETIHEQLQAIGFILEKHDALKQASLPSAALVPLVPLDVTVKVTEKEAEEVDASIESAAEISAFASEVEATQSDKQDAGEKGENKKRVSSASVVIRTIEHITELALYKKLYGDLLVPVKFVIPATEDWPVEHHGFELGVFVFKLRLSVKKSRRSFSAADIQALNDLDFIWDLSDNKTNNVMTALRTFKGLHHNMNVPYKYVVPHDNPLWPKCTWGVKLGTIMNNIKHNNSYAQRHDELVALGIDFNVGHNTRMASSSETNTNTLSYLKRRGGLSAEESAQALNQLAMATHQHQQMQQQQQQTQQLQAAYMMPLQNMQHDQAQQQRQQQRYLMQNQQQLQTGLNNTNSDSEDEDDGNLNSSINNNINNNLGMHSNHLMMGGGGNGSALISSNMMSYQPLNSIPNTQSLPGFSDQQFYTLHEAAATNMAIESLTAAMYRPMNHYMSGPSNQQLQQFQSQNQQFYANMEEMFPPPMNNNNGNNALLQHQLGKRKVGDV